MYIESYSRYSFISGFFQLSIKFLKIFRVVTCFSGLFLFISEEYSIACLYSDLFIHSADDGHLGCFQFGVTTKKPTTDIIVHTFLCLHVFISLE